MPWRWHWQWKAIMKVVMIVIRRTPAFQQQSKTASSWGCGRQGKPITHTGPSRNQLTRKCLFLTMDDGLALMAIDKFPLQKMNKTVPSTDFQLNCWKPVMENSQRPSKFCLAVLSNISYCSPSCLRLMSVKNTHGSYGWNISHSHIIQTDESKIISTLYWCEDQKY